MTAIFPVFGKLKRVKESNINPMIFNVYFQCGVVLFCVIATIIISTIGPHTIEFSYMGLTSGILLGIGGWFVWLALTYMGMAHTSAIASGIASVTGFIEGITIGYYPDHIGLSIFALFLIVIGIVGIGMNETLTSFIVKRLLCHSEQQSLEILTLDVETHSNVSIKSPASLFRFSSNPYTTIDDDNINLNDTKSEISLNPNETEMLTKDDMAQLEESDEEEMHQTTIINEVHNQQNTSALTLRTWGIIFSVLGGVCFGSMAFPEEFTKPDTTEVYFLPSFGVGCLLMIIVDMAVLSMRMSEDQSWHFEACFIPGLASGIIWAMGFLAILYASILIDYSLAIPIRECSICVAVLIGIIAFKEVTDKRAIVVTLICVGIVLSGVFVLPLGIE
eukprot:CAMPEP_0201582176 /NCGR_PEP_ID=MMETSP0190_2-20130828/81268_1 /ASSEMBLY_ACC=CAM_ASM_000263 /TAXON_ID=37353 /ORGANISM="Rosalina sp." /LENGTH=389 /DNA_ID=CAMNT_0048021571 /DNA_START=100 /DNA_END=1269 /DNA_ORIENTATION=+